MMTVACLLKTLKHNLDNGTIKEESPVCIAIGSYLKGVYTLYEDEFGNVIVSGAPLKPGDLGLTIE